MEKVTKLILIRHGETAWTKENRYQGHSDIELNEEGCRQARLLAKKFAKERIDCIYASDLSRTWKTAEAIAKPHSLPVKKTPLLREIAFGKWEGLTFEEMKSKDKELVEKWRNNFYDFRAPQGESLLSLKKRAENFFHQILKKHKGQTILVVSHGGFIRIVFYFLLNLDLSHFWMIKQDPGAINIIEFFAGKPVLSLLNDTCYLKE